MGFPQEEKSSRGTHSIMHIRAPNHGSHEHTQGAHRAKTPEQLRHCKDTQEIRIERERGSSPRNPACGVNSHHWETQCFSKATRKISAAVFPLLMLLREMHHQALYLLLPHRPQLPTYAPSDVTFQLYQNIT